MEKEKSFCDTIRLNRSEGRLSPNLRVYEGDITNFDPFAILRECGLEPGEVDLIVGGPPCQSFSTAGRRGTVRDPRGTLLWEYLRFIEAIRPKFFIMENVRGLLSAALRHRPIAERKGKSSKLMKCRFRGPSIRRRFAENLGSPYHMDCFEVNAVNYGAPQLRERAIFIGNRYNATVDFPDPTHGPDFADNVRTLFEEPKSLKPWKTLGDAIGHINDPGDVIMDFSPRKKSFLEMVPPGSNWRSLPVEVQQKFHGAGLVRKGRPFGMVAAVAMTCRARRW